MTILVGTMRESFAILAAEQMKAGPNGPAGYSCKLVWHQDRGIPLAFGVATGNATWVDSPGQPGRPITDLLQELAAGVTSPDQLVLEDIAGRVKAKLQPGYDEIKREAVVAIALCREGKAALGFQHIGQQQDLEVGPRPPFLPGPPSSLRAFYNPACCDLVHAAGVTNAKEVVEEMRRFVWYGIRHEQVTVPNTEMQQAGGQVNVVLVDKDGARL
jgi:hypothetical protein